MKVLLINGSPNPSGNTFLSLQECAGEIEKQGIETEIFHIGAGPFFGCVNCGGCSKADHCVQDGDILPLMVEKMAQADGIIVGSPTYYGGPNGALCALLDRAFFSASRLFRHKPAAAIVVCRRGGATEALSRLNMYFTLNEMPLISSQYWNITHGLEPGDVQGDPEGMQTMRVLGKNMAHAVRHLPAGEYPEWTEKRLMTNFIR